LEDLLAIDPNFIQDNWKLISDIMNGVEGAYERLGAK
jgi:hypothetical protein